MALLHRVRHGRQRLKGRSAATVSLGRAIAAGVALALVLLSVGACDRGVPPELRPDEVLRSELGLGDDDEVHRVLLTGGSGERVDPVETVVPPGAWVEFVSGDFRLREVRFVTEEMGTELVGFLERTDQLDSPPMVDRDTRFVVSFAGAPPGRYPFKVAGETEPGRGVVIVAAPR